MKYKKLVETQLDSFLSLNSINEEEMKNAVARVALFDPETLSCIDYLLASTDY